MDIKQQILHYYRVEETSLREISRKTGTGTSGIPNKWIIVDAS